MTTMHQSCRSWLMLGRRHHQDKSLLRRPRCNGNNPSIVACIRNVSNDSSSSNGSNSMNIYNSLSSTYNTLPPYTSSPSSNNTLDTTSNNKSINQPSSSSTTTQPRRGTAWYVCGPTVYDSAHLGHGRTYVSLDIMRRVALNLHNGSSGGGGYNNNGTTANNGGKNGSSSLTPRPLYVMNITDVDDKIITRSMEIICSHNKKEEEADPLSLARYYEAEFWQDMDALNVLRPDVICRVSEHVDETIVPYIEQIVKGGMAYVIPEEGDAAADHNRNIDSRMTEDGDCMNVVDGGSSQQQQQQQQKSMQPSQQGSVYFDVRAFEYITQGRTKYGKLAPDVASTDFFSWESNENDNGNGEHSNNNEEVGDSNNNTNVEGDEEKPILRRKRDPRDFSLWKYRPRSSSSHSPTNTIIEPASVSYPSPWGPGRPGWHVECSAMIQRLSQDFVETHEFNVHAGGVDLKFPHHSNEIAQAEAYIASGGSSGNNSSVDGKSSSKEEEFNEWIPHWIHTGHLYVKGRKMSKSLKNFVTIREMLGTDSTQQIDDTTATPPTALEQSNNNNNAWSCPADDFRLWCLGLSGAYRGSATYSKDRMDEAKSIRTKWVRFLMEGQECLDRLKLIDDGIGNDDTHNFKSTTRLWGDEELHLFHTITQCNINCRQALLNDLDGSSFVKELTCIADVGLAYVEQVKQTDGQQKSARPEEPLRFVLDTLRSQLDLVGFTLHSVNAGIISTGDTASSREHSGIATSSNAALVDEAVAFRSAVRSAALGALRNKNKNKKKDGNNDADDDSCMDDAIKEILSLCDDMRNVSFPKLGVEILDGKVLVSVEKENGDNEGGANRGWRHCSPRR